MEAVREHLEIFNELRRRKRWGTEDTYLRFAALTLAYANEPDLAQRLENAAAALREKAGWSSPLRSSLRYSVAALIIKNGLSPVRTHAAVKATRESFRSARLSRSGIPSTMAALLLVVHQGGRKAPATHLRRMRAFYDAWKEDHPWLTGQDDYPMAALHATRDDDVMEVSKRIEEIYQAARQYRFSRGNQLQLASHILALEDLGALEAAQRLADVRAELKGLRIRTYESHYDELALLTLVRGGAYAIARDFQETVEALRAARPRPSKSLAFSIAAGLLLARDGKERLASAAADIGAIQAAQAALAAQQAAIAAAVAAASITATTAATAGG